ncbi:MAG TPA: hypothetical protein VG326_08965 [Tepidisphaeraceae bacterium]|nr:hypothetical protein [Tepidisphaeraceae bacterium]
MSQSTARAGNIFDDNWTPPAPIKPAALPTDTHETKPSPTPIKPESAKPETSKPNESPKTPAVVPPVPSTGATPGRRAIPDPAAQAKSRKLFKGIYAKELADHSAAARRELAAKLLAQAASISDAPADEFVLLAAATDAGREGSDLGVLCKAADVMADVYDVDGLRLKSDRAMKMTLRSDSPAVEADNCRAGMKLADELVVAEDYTSALRILQSLRSAAPDATLRSEVSARIRDVDAQRIAAEHVVGQIRKLKTTPDDPAANLAVGKYLCFVKGDWAAGLPLLAKSTDVPLKAIAQQELSAASDARAILSLADAWIGLAAKTTGTAQARMQRRAVKWYDEALPSLTGLEKVIVEKKRGSLMANLTGFNGHRMSPEEVVGRFTFPNKTFHINGDTITGEAGNCDTLADYIWLGRPENMHSFEFGFDIKAKWDQIAAVEIDGRPYTFSRGHWGNGDTKVWAQGHQERHVPGNVKSAADWDSIKVTVEDGKMIFFYNGVIAATEELVTPITKTSMVKVGFSSNSTGISVRNVYISER